MTKPLPTTTRTLAEIEADIPSMECRKGCNACCGSVMMSTKEEADAFKTAASDSLPGVYALPPKLPHGPKAYVTDRPCPKAIKSDKGEGCTIHDKRPFICRLFGSVDGDTISPKDPAKLMACPYGHKPRKPLTALQANSLMQEYFAYAMQKAKATS